MSNPTKCDYCGIHNKPNEDGTISITDIVKCEQCGTTTCSDCAEEDDIHEDEKYCPQCGNPIDFGTEHELAKV